MLTKRWPKDEWRQHQKLHTQKQRKEKEEKSLEHSLQKFSPDLGKEINGNVIITNPF